MRTPPVYIPRPAQPSIGHLIARTALQAAKAAAVAIVLIVIAANVQIAEWL